MVSIVICSVNEQYLQQVSQSISDSIGIRYELLVWDNRMAHKGICEVYNLMAEKARYPILLFLHEDVSFRTASWGKILAEKFDTDSEVGMIGVAGSSYKSRMYSGCYTGQNNLDSFHIIHRNGEEEIVMNAQPDKSASYFKCVCLDGVFLMCRKEVWQKLKFNEPLLKGFHFYDVDFSIRATKLCKVLAAVHIDLVHYTVGGDFGNKWVEQAFVFHRTFNQNLPVSVGEVPVNIELAIAKLWLDRLKDEKVTLQNRFKWVYQQRLWLFPTLWYSIFKFFMYNPLRLKYIHHFFKK